MSTMARVPSLLVIVLCAVLAAALFASCSPLAIVNAGRHIFPGSCIPSVAVMSDALARVTDMRVCHLEDIGAHYATTLRRWRENLLANLDRVARSDIPKSSSACGSSTSATAKAVSLSAPSAMCRCCWLSPTRGRRLFSRRYVQRDSWRQPEPKNRSASWSRCRHSR